MSENYAEFKKPMNLGELLLDFSGIDLNNES